MSLLTPVTARVTHDLLTNVLTLLSSISSPLSLAERREVVTTVLTNHPAARFAANNDLGLCIARMQTACEIAGISAAPALEAHYASLRAGEPMVNELMGSMASGIAERLSGTLYDLRHTLPRDAQTLTATILSRLPPDATEDLPPPRHFSWGKLAAPACRDAAMLFAQDRLKCFSRGTCSIFDTEKICQALPFGEFQPVATADTIRPLLTQALTAVSPEATDQASAIGMIASPSVFRKWVGDAREGLRNGPIGAAVVDITQRIDGIEDRLRQVDAAMLSSLGPDVTAVQAALLANMETVFNNIQLIRAAMLYHKDALLADKIILTPHVAQQDVLDRFREEGGTEAAVQDYIAYLRLNEQIPFQPRGVSIDVVRSMRQKARDAVAANAKRLADMTKARRAVALQDALMVGLDTWHRRQTEAGMTHARLNHDQRRQHALVSLRQRPVETIALEYLAAMRQDPLTEKLFTTINAELVAVARQENDITERHVAQATCRAVATYLLAELTSRFAPRRAA